MLSEPKDCSEFFSSFTSVLIPEEKSLWNHDGAEGGWVWGGSHFLGRCASRRVDLRKGINFLGNEGGFRDRNNALRFLVERKQNRSNLPKICMCVCVIEYRSQIHFRTPRVKPGAHLKAHWFPDSVQFRPLDQLSGFLILPDFYLVRGQDGRNCQTARAIENRAILLRTFYVHNVSFNKTWSAFQ